MDRPACGPRAEIVGPRGGPPIAKRLTFAALSAGAPAHCNRALRPGRSCNNTPLISRQWLIPRAGSGQRYKIRRAYPRLRLTSAPRAEALRREKQVCRARAFRTAGRCEPLRHCNRALRSGRSCSNTPLISRQWIIPRAGPGQRYKVPRAYPRLRLTSAPRAEALRREKQMCRARTFRTAARCEPLRREKRLCRAWISPAHVPVPSPGLALADPSLAPSLASAPSPAAWPGFASSCSSPLLGGLFFVLSSPLLAWPGIVLGWQLADRHAQHHSRPSPAARQGVVLGAVPSERRSGPVPGARQA